MARLASIGPGSGHSRSAPTLATKPEHNKSKPASAPASSPPAYLYNCHRSHDSYRECGRPKKTKSRGSGVGGARGRERGQRGVHDWEKSGVLDEDEDEDEAEDGEGLWSRSASGLEGRLARLGLDGGKSGDEERDVGGIKEDSEDEDSDEEQEEEEDEEEEKEEREDMRFVDDEAEEEQVAEEEEQSGEEQLRGQFGSDSNDAEEEEIEEEEAPPPPPSSPPHRQRNPKQKLKRYRPASNTAFISSDPPASEDSDSPNSLADFIVSDSEPLTTYSSFSDSEPEPDANADLEPQPLSPPPRRPAGRRRLIRGRRPRTRMPSPDPDQASGSGSGLWPVHGEEKGGREETEDEEGGIGEVLAGLSLSGPGRSEEPGEPSESQSKLPCPRQPSLFLSPSPSPSPSSSPLQTKRTKPLLPSLPPSLPSSLRVDDRGLPVVETGWRGERGEEEEGEETNDELFADIFEKPTDDIDDTIGKTPDRKGLAKTPAKTPSKTPSKTPAKTTKTPAKTPKTPTTTPAKAAKAAKDAWAAEREPLARRFVAELDGLVADGRVGARVNGGRGIELVWSRTLNKTAGRANWTRNKIRNKIGATIETKTETEMETETASIELAAKVISTRAQLLNTLMHEYCHLANFVLSRQLRQPHGASFRAWGARCLEALGSRSAEFGPDVRAGALVVSTRHGYAIEYRYLWRCVGDGKQQEKEKEKEEGEGNGCGKEYGRHSRSIDVRTARCGVCRGKLVQVRPKPRRRAGKVDE